MQDTRRRIMILLFVLAVHGTGYPVKACPMCSENLPETAPPANSDPSQVDPITPPSGGSLAKGFYYSILLMLAVPFLLITGLSGMLYRAIRKSDNLQINPAPVSTSSAPIAAAIDRQNPK